MRAHGFEYFLDGDRFITELSVCNAATVQSDPGNIHACQCHCSGRNSFIAAAQYDHGIQAMTLDG